MTKTVTISLEEYAKLVNDQSWLRALEVAGVEDWEGVDEAIDILQAKHNESEVEKQ